MRPKIVILTLAIALGLVGVLVVMKGMMGGGPGNGGNSGSETPATEANKEATPLPGDVPVDPNSTNSPAALEQLHAAEIQKELDLVSELLAGGANPSTTAALVSKLAHPEAEVRKAAVEALVQLNDTNAVPGLEQAASLVQDPREKVTLLDAVAYLKLPEMTADSTGGVAEATASAPGSAAPRKATTNPQTQPRRKGRRSVPRATQPAVPGNPDQTQPPAASTPDTPQAQ